MSDPVTKTGDYISILVVLELVVLIAAIFIAHYTRFGRTVYAIGGNEQSARLMGLPVNSTKVLVYTLNGFCSALAGIALSIYVSSGHGSYAKGFELSVIAAVVIGGTMLTGGAGYVFGTPFGVLTTGVTQTLIQFNGHLSSWWTNIVVGALTLVFIGVQSLIAARKVSRLDKTTKQKKVGFWASDGAARNRRILVYGGGAVVVVVLTAVLIGVITPKNENGMIMLTGEPETTCEFKPYRQEQAMNLLESGAVLTYERNGGPNCIDELYAIYSDGSIVGDNGKDNIEKQSSPEELEQLLSGISDRGWFTDEMYNTWHTPCGQCYGYYITVSYNDQEKTVKAVDGGTDAPADYWQVVSLINGYIPKFEY